VDSFHVFPDGETISAMLDLNDFERGVLVGVLIGEGHFGGDGRQPHVTLRMHTRHQALFSWLLDRVPGSRLYGPYHHGGRSYYQWMVRGRPLVEDLLPVLEEDVRADVDGHAALRLARMQERYAGYIRRIASRSDA
jgi:hypothetical protein